MIEHFLLWCAGSDKEILNRCPEYEKTKHIGFGSLVLSPAVLAFISMSYALSTIDKISKKPDIFIFGGIIWGIIIFSFDRFIVSTHRRERNNIYELKNIYFYIRFSFSVILGIVISHPLVLMYFERSIVEKIKNDANINAYNETLQFQKQLESASSNLTKLTKRKECLEKLLTAEQSGHKISLDCGYSSGIANTSGNYPRTKVIEGQIKSCDADIVKEKDRIESDLSQIKRIHQTQSDILLNPSYDYLNREVKLDELKKSYPIVGWTQWLLMLCFVFIDVLPVTLKTFAPYGIYDQIIAGDLALMNDINTSSRKNYLQKLYNDIHDDKRSSLKLSKIIDDFSNTYDVKKNAFAGFIIGVVFFVLVIEPIGSLNTVQILTWSAISSIPFSIIANAIYDIMKKYLTLNSNPEKTSENA